MNAPNGIADRTRTPSPARFGGADNDVGGPHGRERGGGGGGDAANLILWSCTYCGRRIACPGELAERTVKCGFCRHLQIVPADSRSPRVFGTRMVIPPQPSPRGALRVRLTPAASRWRDFQAGLAARHRLRVGEKGTGRRCPYCLTTLGAGEDVAVCPQCFGVHHADCWGENEGCGHLGCGVARRPSRHLALPVTGWGQLPDDMLKNTGPCGEWSMKAAGFAAVVAAVAAILSVFGAMNSPLDADTPDQPPIVKPAESYAPGAVEAETGIELSGGGMFLFVLVMIVLGGSSAAAAASAVVLGVVHFFRGRSLPGDRRAAALGLLVGSGLLAAWTWTLIMVLPQT